MIRVLTIVQKRSSSIALDVSMFCSAKQLPQLAAAAIFAEHSDYSHVIDKFAQVPGNIGRAAGVKRFSGHLHDRDRRLRRDAADLSPDKFVKHQIADNGDPPRSRALKDLLQPIQFHGDLRLGAYAAQIACGFAT